MADTSYQPRFEADTLISFKHSTLGVRHAYVDQVSSYFHNAPHGGGFLYTCTDKESNQQYLLFDIANHEHPNYRQYLRLSPQHNPNSTASAPSYSNRYDDDDDRNYYERQPQSHNKYTPVGAY